MLNCVYSGVCGGCTWAGKDLASQHEAKLTEVRKLYNNVRFAFTPESRVRDRADLVWENGRLGLYRTDKREILDLESCPMMSEALEKFFKEYRKRKPPIRKGSVRLRVAPDGSRGVWLDFANQDVKALFEEKEYLLWLSELAFVEIGQRRKVLVWKEDQPKLKDPELRPWFETYGVEGRAIPLYGPVGGFSQSGFAANRALVEAVADLAQTSGVKNWVELFCGNGNFTLALADRGFAMEAVEMDPLAVEGLQKSLPPQTKLVCADVYLKNRTLPPFGARGLLVDPPRAGLREVLQRLEGEDKESLPTAILYVSCFTEVFVADAERLQKLGYRIESLVGVDQFPNSPHAEWVALLTRR